MAVIVADAHLFWQLLISVALGLLVGLQRQWAEDPLAGARTFALISLLGTVLSVLAGNWGAWLIGAGFLGVIAIIVVGHLSRRETPNGEPRAGMSTEVAMLLMYSLGAMIPIGPIWLAAAGTGVIAVILQAKIELHQMARRFTADELRAVMQFVLISLVLFPIMPNQSFGPYDVLNPHDIWLMVILIVGISLAGYVTYKFFGSRAGILLGGFLGGLISSTATTVSYARRTRADASGPIQSAIIVSIAWTVVYFRVFFEVAVAAPSFRAVWGPLAAMAVVSVAATVWLRTRGERRSGVMPPQQNPTEMKTALVFAVLYSVILMAVAYAKERLGSEGLLVVAVISGVTDMDAITLSTSRLVQSGKLLGEDGWPVIIAAATSNVAFKGMLAGALGGTRLFKALLVPWLLSLLAGVALLLFWP